MATSHVEVYCVPSPPFADPPGTSKKIKMDRENESQYEKSPMHLYRLCEFK